MLRIEESPPLIAPPHLAVPQPQRAPTLIAIVLFKLLKGTLLLTAAGVVFSLVGSDLQREFARALELANFNPESKMFSELAGWLQTITPANVRAIATGTVLYSACSLIEGTGLWFRAGWAGWLAIAESAFFIPIEVYEVFRRYSTSVAVILLANVAIVWYLYANRERLFRH